MVISDTNDAIVGVSGTADCVFHFTNNNTSLNIEEGANITVGANCLFVFGPGVTLDTYSGQVFTVDSSTSGVLVSNDNVKWIKLTGDFNSNEIATYRTIATSTPLSASGQLTIPPTVAFGAVNKD